MLVVHEKRCSTATQTISGGADVVKPITSHGYSVRGHRQYFAGKGRGHTVERHAVERQTIAKQNNHDK